MNKKNKNQVSQYKDFRVNSFFKMLEYANQSPKDKVRFILHEENGETIILFLNVHQRKNYMEGPVGMYFILSRNEVNYKDFRVDLLFQMVQYAQIQQRVPRDKVFFVLQESYGVEYALELQSFDKSNDSVVFSFTRTEPAESIPDIPLEDLIDEKTREIYNQLKKAEEGQ
jgi:hypothetical protein